MIREQPGPPPTGIASDEVTIRPVEPEDASLLTVWRAETSVRRHQPLSTLSAHQIRTEISARHHFDLGRNRGERFDWIVEWRRRPVGWITLVIHSWAHGLAECGYAVSTAYQGRGIMPIALQRLLDELFTETDLYRVEARCATDNRSSQRVLEKLGFIREGVLRRYFQLDGKRVDNYLYALLREEWQPEGS